DIGAGAWGAEYFLSKLSNTGPREGSCGWWNAVIGSVGLGSILAPPMVGMARGVERLAVSAAPTTGSSEFGPRAAGPVLGLSNCSNAARLSNRAALGFSFGR